MMMATAQATRKILLVEDNPGDVRLVREALKEVPGAGRLRNVGSVDEALDLLLRRGTYADAQRPSLILLDLNLPRRNGLDLLREMKGHPEIGTIPVVVLTSSTSSEDRRLALAHAARSFVTKPQSLDAYVALLRAVTGGADPEARGTNP